MSGTFEGTSAGNLPDAARLECGVCWWVFDPAIGEDIYDTPIGTPFTALGEDWRCPSCDAPKSKFMAVEPGATAAGANYRPPLPTLEARIGQLVAAFEKAEDNMVGLPVHNDKLRIEAVGFEPFGDYLLGVMVSPWSMNLTLVPIDPDAPPAGALGASNTHAFPSGNYNFIIGRMEGVGILETCSLFSPMDEFDDPDVAAQVARAALDGLLEIPEETVAKANKPVSRRFILALNGKPA